MKRLIPLLLLLFPLSGHATTAITRVGSCNGTTSCTPPVHQAGDLFIAYAFRNNSNTQPTLPAGWTAIHTASGTGNASDIVACKVAITNGETITGFTNATGLIGLVYRGAVVYYSETCASLIMGGQATNQNAGSATISYDGFTLTDTGNTSWVIGCAGSVTATDVGTAPTGMTNITTASSGAVGCHDTNTTTSTWSTQTVGVNASAAWQSITMELRACTTLNCLLSNVQGSSAGSTTTIVSPAANHGAGHKLIAVIRNLTTGTNVSSIANTAGDTWALCASSRQSTVRHTEIWETTNTPNGNSADITTVTMASSDTNKIVNVLELLGVVIGACGGASTGSCTSCNSITSGSFTATTGGYNVAVYYSANSGTFTVGSGYTSLWNPNPTTFFVQQKISASSGSQTTSATLAINNDVGMSVATFTGATATAGQVGAFLVGP